MIESESRVKISEKLFAFLEAVLWPRKRLLDCAMVHCLKIVLLNYERYPGKCKKWPQSVTWWSKN